MNNLLDVDGEMIDIYEGEFEVRYVIHVLLVDHIMKIALINLRYFILDISDVHLKHTRMFSYVT